MSNEDTILKEDEKTVSEETIVSQDNKKPVTEPVKKKVRLNKTAAVAAAVGGGIGSVFAHSMNNDGEEEVAEDDVVEVSESEVVTAETVDAEPIVNDEMSFGEAFAAARAAYGPGAEFEWHGNTYHTYTKEEVDAQNVERIAENTEDVVPAETVADVEEYDEVEIEDVQVIGVDSDEAIIIDEDESAFVADVDEVYVEVYEDTYSDMDSYVQDDPMF